MGSYSQLEFTNIILPGKSRNEFDVLGRPVVGFRLHFDLAQISEIIYFRELESHALERITLTV